MKNEEFTMPDLSAYDESEIINPRNEWLKKRRGYFTASEFYKLMTVMGSPDKLPTGAITYVNTKVAESLTEFVPDDGFTTAAMQWGIETELQAIDSYIEKTGNAVMCTGDNQQFIEYTHYTTLTGHVGGTPDGIIYNARAKKIGGIEIKCPNSDTHLTNLINIKCASDLADRYPNYYWQCQGLMMITGLESWQFVSFDPRYKVEKHRLHIVQIDRNPKKLLELQRRLVLAVELKNSILAKLNERTP